MEVLIPHSSVQNQRTEMGRAHEDILLAMYNRHV